MRQKLPIGNFEMITDEDKINQLREELIDENYIQPEYHNADFKDNENYTFKDFEQEKEDNFEAEKNTNNLPITKGYYFEVDLSYPHHLHDDHVGLPMAPEHLNGKLIPNLGDKKKYKVYYETLKLYISSGLVIDKIHRILMFDETYYLREYIDFNTRMRKNSTTNMEKNMFKLMNNSICILFFI